MFLDEAIKEVDHFKKVSAVLLKKLLPRHESRSINLSALLTEVLGGVIWGAFDRISDPDTINLGIIASLQPASERNPELKPGWNMLVFKSTQKIPHL